MTIRELQEINARRAERWHTTALGIEDWTPLEWAGAMAGEAGEACNAAKKLKRLQGQLANVDSRLTTEQRATEEDYKLAVGNEVADTVIYGVLLCERVGIDLEEAVRRVFNKKSEEYGFPEKL